VIFEGPGQGTEYELGEAAILGRLETNEIPIQDKKASRQHAKIFKHGQGYAIADLNSSNGTKVNGKSITKQKLEPGDEISIGYVHLRYEFPELEQAKQAAAKKRVNLEQAFDKKSAPKAGVRAGAKPGDIVMKAHAPLQFHRVKPGNPILGFDLDQLSELGRIIVYAGLMIVFAVLIYVGYVVVAG